MHLALLRLLRRSITSTPSGVTAHTAIFAQIPSNISYDEASTLPAALTAPYIGLYNQSPHGIGLVPPVTPEGMGKYAGNPIVILGGSSSVGQNGKLQYHFSKGNLQVTPTTQLFNLRNFLVSRLSSPLRLSSMPSTSNLQVQPTSLIVTPPLLLQHLRLAALPKMRPSNTQSILSPQQTHSKLLTTSLRPEVNLLYSFQQQQRRPKRSIFSLLLVS